MSLASGTVTQNYSKPWSGLGETLQNEKEMVFLDHESELHPRQPIQKRMEQVRYAISQMEQTYRNGHIRRLFQHATGLWALGKHRSSLDSSCPIQGVQSVRASASKQVMEKRTLVWMHRRQHNFS